MTADFQPETEKATDSHGDVQPSTNKGGKLEDRIGEEKDEGMANESGLEDWSTERRRSI